MEKLDSLRAILEKFKHLPAKTPILFERLYDGSRIQASGIQLKEPVAVSISSEDSSPWFLGAAPPPSEEIEESEVITLNAILFKIGGTYPLLLKDLVAVEDLPLFVETPSQQEYGEVSPILSRLVSEKKLSFDNKKVTFIDDKEGFTAIIIRL